MIPINWLFQCLETYTGMIRQTSIESYLYRADPRRFGVEPTVWLFTHSTPLLTDDMALHAQRGRFELQQGAFDSADPLRTRSAFPSLHGSLALLYLRHRGLVGVFAGLIASAVASLAPTLRMRWPRLAHGS